MLTKKHKRSMGIGEKTLLSHIALALSVVVLSSLLIYALSTNYIRASRKQDLERKAGYLAEISSMFQYGRFTLPDRDLVNLYESLLDAKMFYIYADTGIIRMSNYREDAAEEGEDALQWVEVIDSIDREFARRVLDGESVSTLSRFEFAQGVVVFAGAPVVDAEGVIRGGIILAQPIEKLHTLTRSIMLMILAVFGVSILIAVLLSTQQARMLVRPLQTITRSANRMEAGVYAERISGLPDNEIGDLGRALNSMSGRLVDVIRNLRKERDKLEIIISRIDEGLIAVNTQWQVVHFNDSFLELTELENAEQFTDADAEARLGPIKAMMERCMQTGKRGKVEWTNASQRALQATASTINDETGAIIGAVCLLRDVSEAQRMEQLRREYVANISHELRTPLTGIRGMVEPLIDGVIYTEEERQDSYHVILRETIRLEKLVGEMLDMSRLQDGRLKIALEPMELPGILEAAARSMHGIAEESGVQLTVETDGSRLACMGNEDRIMQVLVILIDNALSFTPEGGRVTVFAYDADDHINVGVRDNGCGIEPKDLPFIWERFYKADKSRMRTTGTGLGLSIAKLVTGLMGGDISVRSEPGKGAEFTFTLNKVPAREKE